MSTDNISSNSNNCVICAKNIKECHKNISCQRCKGYVHKKCTKLKQKQLKSVDRNEWICPNCITVDNDNNVSDDVDELNESPQFNVTDIDFTKYDHMIFNPLRFDSSNTGKNYNDIVNNNDGIHECSYLTPEQFCLDRNANRGNFNLLNVNIRSLSKNFDSLKACIKKQTKNSV